MAQPLAKCRAALAEALGAGHTLLVLRLAFGLIKGAVIGGAVGYGAYALGFLGALHWLTYGLVGAFVGLLVGRPIWRHLTDKSATLWTAALKAIFGYGVGVGLFALVAKAWGGFDISMMGETRILTDWQFVFGGAVGALYGAFVELDDAAPKEAPKALPE